MSERERRRRRSTRRPTRRLTTTARGAPEQTKDDTDVGWGETTDPQAARDEHERWLQEQRPPHWD